MKVDIREIVEIKDLDRAKEIAGSIRNPEWIIQNDLVVDEQYISFWNKGGLYCYWYGGKNSELMEVAYAMGI